MIIKKNIFLAHIRHFKTLNKKISFYNFYVPKINLKKKIKIKNIRKVSLKKKIKGTPEAGLKKKIFKDNYFNKKINIKVTSNNIFCTCINFITNKIIYNGSGGLYKIKVSKKKLKLVYKNILYKFFGFLRKKYRRKFLNRILVCVSAPITLRKKITRAVMNILLKLKNLKIILLKMNKKKCFNGCRASKVRRKKNLKFKIYK
jgi:hypothetical protein